MTVLTDELIDKICALRRTGLNDLSRANACRVPRSTFGQWMEIGARDIDAGKDSAFAKLYAGMAEADSAFLSECMSIIAGKAASGNWQAAAWLLERTHPEHYAESKRLEMGGSADGVTVINDAPTRVEVGSGTGAIADVNDKRK